MHFLRLDKTYLFLFIFSLLSFCMAQLKHIFNGRIDGETLKSYASHWPPQRWQEYEPLLSYCRDNGVRLVACGTPLEVCLHLYINL